MLSRLIFASRPSRPVQVMIQQVIPTISQAHPKILLPGFRSAPTTPTLLTDYGSADHTFEKDRLIKNPPPDDDNNRDFTYFMIGCDQMMFLSLSRLALIRVRDT